MRHHGFTPLFRGPAGEPLPNSIAEVGYHRIGGIDQWVLIRGEDVANPPLIVLHGGPGMTEMRFFRHYNAVLEKSFTVVHWDQRGTGKSFDRTIPRASMTIEQFLSDLGELVDMVRSRLGKEQVVILGHSWGSVLGVLYAARFPEKVAAYVGVAQIADAAAAESASYAYALDAAQRHGNEKALKELRAIGPPPYDANSLWTERTWVQQLDGQMGPKTIWKLSRIILGGPESSIADLPNVVRGFKFSLDSTWAEASRVNLFESVPELTMPVFFFLGRRDHWVPGETSAAYFDALRAPSKTLVWFEASGHQVFADEPEKFNRTMLELVLPAVKVRAFA